MISRNLLSDMRVRGLLFPLLFAVSGALISNFIIGYMVYHSFSRDAGSPVPWVLKETIVKLAMIIPYVIPRFFFKRKKIRFILHTSLLLTVFIFYGFLIKSSLTNVPWRSIVIMDIATISGIAALCMFSLFLDPKESLRKGMSALMIAIFVRFISAWCIRTFSYHLLAMAETFLFLGIGLGLVFGDWVGEKVK